MTEASKSGKELFIVDNSVSGWTGVNYLQQWTEIARSFDIATGYFEIGSLLALDGHWQKLDKIRLLMGSEMTLRTRKALREAINVRTVEALDRSLEATKDVNPLLTGVDSILQGLRSGQIECRVYDREKFHAKAYITHAKLEVVGAQALVGSSNFTLPGLTDNIELNIQVQSAREVAQLQDWYDQHWQEASLVNESVIETVERHVQLYRPFHIYAKALQEYFQGHEISSSEWDERHSRMFPVLDRYQKEAYWALIKIAHQHGGAFLCDGVGLGKTFVGLMLIERLVLHEGKRVVLFAPKAAKDAVWQPHLASRLQHIGGMSGSQDFSNLAVFSHTDLLRKGDFPDRFDRITELADAVIVDEAHHFRNPGRALLNAIDGQESRYSRLFRLLDSTTRPKTLYMLTATPINNRLSDFRHMIELFSRRDEGYFARTLGINNLRAYFNQMEKSLRSSLDVPARDTMPDLAEVLPEVQRTLAADDLFQELVVQRSRAYARESQIRENVFFDAEIFPDRKPPVVAEYSIRKTYGNLLDMFESAFSDKNLFTLAMYYPLAWYRGNDATIDPFEENRQKQVVGLIRTLFLKRFESSVSAFEKSCQHLLRKQLGFIEVHSETEAEQRRLERWKVQHAETLGQVSQQTLWDEEDEDDFLTPELLESIEKLDRTEYDVSEMIQETYLDCDQIASFIDEARQFEPKHDDKLQKLIRICNSKDVGSQKLIIFTEFADTARYLHVQLKEKCKGVVEEVDSGSHINRADVIQRFAPYYNGSTSEALRLEGRTEIDVLISTDVLSEGLNLQDATRLVNYDIHWNPVRLMQRIGRVDRRMDPIVEQTIVADHPEVAPTRGKVMYWNFLPPEELNVLLSLYSKVTQKTLLISKTLGIEGRRLLTPDDEYQALKEFNQAYEGEKSASEAMHLEYQDLLASDQTLETFLDTLPGSVFSGRRIGRDERHYVFFCYRLPALDRTTANFSYEAGITRWYLLDLDSMSIVDEVTDILPVIRCDVDEPRHVQIAQAEFVVARKAVLKHITNTYLKRVDAPLGVNPLLKCWMEVTAEGSE